MSEERPQGEFPAEVRRAHSPDETDAWGIFRFGIVLVISTSALLLLLAGLYVAYRAQARAADQPPPPLARERTRAPGPRLEEREWETLEKVRADEHEHLDTYGWVDRERGIVRIPIAEAMKLAAEGRRAVVPATRPATQGVSE
jgi:hypothetical protein